jgi:uncharacterized protein YjbI with pentapeptide repeats
MAQLEHVITLAAGVAVWNKWRLENPDVRPDLSDVNLSGKHLNDIDFRGANLWRAKLNSVDLRGADLSNADLTEAVVEHARLDNARFRGARLSRAQFGRSSLCGADLSDADLSGAIFSGADLTNVRLVRGNVGSAQFRGSRLENADFTGARGLDAAYFDPGVTLTVQSLGGSWHDLPADRSDTPVLVLRFDANLSGEQLEGVLRALSDYYRACGGIGLVVSHPEATPSTRVELYAS